MKLYIPSSYSEWLSTKPEEGQVLLIGLLTKFAAIYGSKHWFEMYTEDIDTVLFTAGLGAAYPEVRKLKELELVQTMKGLSGKLTLRCAEARIGHINRRSIYKDVIEYDLSHEAALIWSYLLGRLANVDETKDISEIATIRAANSTRDERSLKKSLTHILAPIYNDAFTKRHIGIPMVDANEFDTDEVEVSKTKVRDKKQQYARDWYEKNRKEQLQKKKTWYYDTQKKHNKDDNARI
jgi:hypothetical protein